MKRDINLIPVKKSDPKKRKSVIIAVVVTFVYVVVFGLGFLIPKGIKDASLALEKQFDNQIVQLQPKVDEYTALKTQLDELRTSMETTGAIHFSEYNAMTALEIIQSTCPTGISVESISNTEMAMQISCLASDNYQIAQFALELERTGHFQAVILSGSQPADMIMDETEASTTGNAVRSTINLVYNLTELEDVAANSTGTGSSGASGTGGQSEGGMD